MGYKQRIKQRNRDADYDDLDIRRKRLQTETAAMVSRLNALLSKSVDIGDKTDAQALKDDFIAKMQVALGV